MAYIPTISSTMSTYLHQWLKIASGDRVVLHQHMIRLTNSFTVFKCKTCGSNWHVGYENFVGTQIPQVLKDWVAKHRHVCSKFTGSHTGDCCVTCKWPYGAHEESWLTSKPTAAQIEATKLAYMTAENQVKRDLIIAAAKAMELSDEETKSKTNVMEIPQGRIFREATCESPDTTEKTSKD